jgi:hypothetical protein
VSIKASEKQVEVALPLSSYDDAQSFRSSHRHAAGIDAEGEPVRPGFGACLALAPHCEKQWRAPPRLPLS